MRTGEVVPVAVTAAVVPFHAVTVNEVARVSVGLKAPSERPGPAVAETSTGTPGRGIGAASATGVCRPTATKTAASIAPNADRANHLFESQLERRPALDMHRMTTPGHLLLRQATVLLTPKGESHP